MIKERGSQSGPRQSVVRHAVIMKDMDTRNSVVASYRHVRRISRRSGSNFYRSFWLLPKAKREAMCALYAFARTTDDLGDCAEPISLRTRWLNWWRQTVAMNLIGECSAEFPPAALSPP